ncbi:MAG TPA: hypothetical protein VMV31_00025 [Terriglobales bacterium]|nr:hypothetical protein [Terriglobales bacterium]
MAVLTSVLAMVFLLGVRALPRPAGAHLFRSRTQSLLLLDQGDGALAGEASSIAPALAMTVRTTAPLPAPQPIVRRIPAPTPRRREGFRPTQALRGPPLAR